MPGSNASKNTQRYGQKIYSSVKCSDRFKQSLYIPDEERQNKSADVANEETRQRTNRLKVVDGSNHSVYHRRRQKSDKYRGGVFGSERLVRGHTCLLSDWEQGDREQ